MSNLLYCCFALLFLSGCNYQYTPRADDQIKIEIALQPVSAEEFNQNIFDTLKFKHYKNGSNVEFDKTTDSYVFRVQHDMLKSSKNSLLVMPHYLSQVNFFNEKLVSVDNFVRNSFSEKRNFSPNIIASVGQGQVSYVLIQNTLSKPIYFAVDDSKDLYAYDQKLLLTFTVIDSIIITLVFVNLIFYFFIRRIGYLFYSIYILSSVVFIFYQEGMVSYFSILSGKPLGIYTNLIWLKLASGFYWLFALVFLNLKNKSKFDFALVKTMILINLFILVLISGLSFFGIQSHYSTIATGINIFIFISVFFAIYVPVKYAFLKERHAKYLAVGILIHMVAVLMRLNFTFTSDPLAFWMPRAFEFGLLLEALILSIGLADRTMKIIEQRDDAELKFRRADRELFCKELENSFQQRSNNTIEKYLGTQKQLDSIINSYFIASLHQLVEVKEVFYVSENESKLDTNLISAHDIEFDVENYIKDNAGLMNQICDTNIPFYQINISKTYSKYPFAIIPIKEKDYDNLCLFLSFPSYVEINRELMNDLYIYANTMTQSLVTVRKYQKTVESSRFDDLTKVFNKETIKSKLDILCSLIPTQQNVVSVAFIDLDDFKQINDLHGHDAGDGCLVFLCDKLKEEFNHDAFVGRYGGDEFIVVFNNYTNQEISNKFTKLYWCFSNYPLNGVTLRLSVGIAISQPNGRTVNSARLLKSADDALYEAKKLGKNQFIIGA